MSESAVIFILNKSTKSLRLTGPGVKEFNNNFQLIAPQALYSLNLNFSANSSSKFTLSHKTDAGKAYFTLNRNGVISSVNYTTGLVTLIIAYHTTPDVNNQLNILNFGGVDS